MTAQTQRSLGSAALLVAVLVFTCGFSYTRTVQVESAPSGANVLIDGKLAGVTPFSQKLQFPKAESVVEIRIEKDRYATEQVTLTGAQAKEIKSSATWRFAFNLVEIRREVPALISSSTEGCTVSVDSKPVGTAPVKQTLVFSRKNGNAEWGTVTIRVERPPNYEATTRTLSVEEAMAALKTGTEWKLDFPLAELRREIPTEVRANIEGATVSVDDKAIGTAPLKHTLVYVRPTGQAPWPELTLKIEREGFEFRPPSEDGQPAFVHRLAITEAGGSAVSATHFVAVRFVLSPVRLFDIQPDRVVVLKSNILSEVSPNEAGKPPTQITSAQPENALVASRISPVPEHAEQIIFSVPKREGRPGAGQGASAEEVVGANIWSASGSAQTQMTEGRQFDIDPFVTADGRWIYFSSDRLRTRNIWRMPASGKGGFTKITGDLSSVDTEPAVSPDGAKLAYASRAVGALSTAPTYIWIANADGTLPTQMRAGRSPAWSPDGKRIAFVSPENKIWLMEADGGNPTQLTLGDSVECCPVWMPLGKHIVFASNKAQNDLKQRNFDIWIMGADSGNQTQLTVNGSFDSFPAISGDGKYLYFFSNRGAQRIGQEALQILRLELPAE